MRRRTQRRAASSLLALALATALAALSGEARAAQGVCSAKERKAASTLADKGFEQFEAADYEAAIASFSEAEERCHSPRLLIFLSRAHARRGELLRARELLQQAADEPITRRSPASFREAQVEARKELEALQPRIPVLQALFTGGPSDGLRVTLDGAEVPAADLQRGQEMDPGEHVLAAEAPGFERAERHVVLREATVERLEVALRPVQPPPDPSADADDRPSMVPPVVAFSVGALGLGVGAVTGLISASTVGDIKTRCQANQCLKSDAEAADRAALLGNVSTVGFIVGGLGVATGAALLILRSGSSSPPPQSGAARVTTVRVGPGSVQLGGTF